MNNKKNNRSTFELDTINKNLISLRLKTQKQTNHNIYAYITDAALTLYAKWAIIITYDKNGATGGTAPESQTKTAGTALTLATNSGSLVNSDLKFTGWNTKTDGTGTTYAVGASYTENKSLTLYAKWSNNKVGTDEKGVILNGIEYEKTSEKVIIATETTVKKATDTSWNNYNGAGVFITGRQVTLSPFIMGKYEVTQELYQAVMGTNPSNYNSSPASGETQKLRPVEQVSWYKAVAFCNKLTKLTMEESDCVYYTDTSFTTVYVSGTGNVYMNPAKKGYRLPTEAEWEYAARGGKDSPTWGYAYAGVQTAKTVDAFNTEATDTVLNNYGWYSSNSGNKTHEVGKKTANALGLYDMSGNLSEFCYDWYTDTVSTETVKDPIGVTSGDRRSERGGSFYNEAYVCSVSHCLRLKPQETSYVIGFRVCRYK